MQSEEAELIEVSPTVMFTNSPSGEASMSPGVTTTDEPDDGIAAEDNDAGKLNSTHSNVKICIFLSTTLFLN